MEHRNLAALQRWQADRLGPLPALRFKRDGLYHDLSWQEYRTHSLACAAALINAGIAPGDRVGLLSENRIEWLIADMGILGAAAVNVPLHAPLSARQIEFQLADAGAVWLFVSSDSQLEKIKQIQAQLPALRGIVLLDLTGSLPHHPTTPISWTAFLQRGRQILTQLQPELARREANLGPDDLATVMYTSGTTGNPKGVMLTHGNLLSNALSCLKVSPVKADSVVLNWLPLSHIYARTVDHYENLAGGVLVCLAEGAETVVENIQETQPTHISSVPRLYEKVLSLVAASDPAEMGRRLKRVFGARLEWLGSGGAPLPVPVAEVFRAAGMDICQGYGLTETSPVITFNRQGNNKIGTVGQAIPGVVVAIAPDGEVLTRGPHVMKGYWKNPEATAEAIRDGWLYTGDLGKLDSEGFLTITGRKKEMLVLSNGKKVSPSLIEGILIADPCIDQAVVCGEGRNYLTALIVPNWDSLKRELRGKGIAIDTETNETLCQHGTALSLLQQRIDTALADVATWERIQKIVVLPRPFSVAAEELTVSLKLRRSIVTAKYQAQLDALYEGQDE